MTSHGYSISGSGMKKDRETRQRLSKRESDRRFIEKMNESEELVNVLSKLK